MTVGVMIGSGIFLLPATLAPYGAISFMGWIITSIGAIVIALVLGHLATRTNRSGGMYIYTKDAFGSLPGFFIAWGYWLAVVFAITAICTAFAGYFGAVFPSIAENKLAEIAVAAVLIWTLTLINMRNVSSGATMQLLTTILKLLPIMIIIGLGFFQGSSDNFPPFNPQNLPITSALATTALLTMWAFVGLEAGLVAAADVKDPKRTIPRAVVAGTLTVTAVYIASTAAIMMLVPMDILQVSNAPFAEAARSLGKWGTLLIIFGALISTAGSANGNILIGGQMPMAVAIDGLAPKFLARRSQSGSPVFALVFTSLISTLLLAFNYNASLLKSFEFLITMSTLCTLLPYAVSALADFKYSWKSKKLGN